MKFKEFLKGKMEAQLDDDVDYLVKTILVPKIEDVDNVGDPEYSEISSCHMTNMPRIINKLEARYHKKFVAIENGKMAAYVLPHVKVTIGGRSIIVNSRTIEIEWVP